MKGYTFKFKPRLNDEQVTDCRQGRHLERGRLEGSTDPQGFMTIFSHKPYL